MRRSPNAGNAMLEVVAARTDAVNPIRTHMAVPVNVGEPGLPLNGAFWTSSDQWPLVEKMGTDFSDKVLLDSSKGGGGNRGGGKKPPRR